NREILLSAGIHEMVVVETRSLLTASGLLRRILASLPGLITMDADGSAPGWTHRFRATLMLTALTVFGAMNATSARTNVIVAPLEIKALEEMEKIESFQLSPDGKLVALLTVLPAPKFSGVGPEVSFGFIRRKLRIIDLSTGFATFVEPLNGDFGSPKWSFDSKQLAYFVGREGSARLGIWSRDSGTSRVVSDVTPRTVPLTLASQLVWLPDSRRVVVAVLPR